MSEAPESVPAWRRVVDTARRAPMPLALPAGIAALCLTLMAAGGALAWVGGWLLTVGFSLAVGAFFTGPRAYVAPLAVWTAWLVISVAAGGAVPRTPVWAALLLAGLGTAGVWLGQRAVRPALREPHGPSSHADRLDPDELDALLEPFAPAEDSPSLDPTAEVDEAIAALLIDDASEHEPDAGTTTEDQDDSQPKPEADGEADPDAGKVIEFDALDEAAVNDAPPLPAATEAGRRRDGGDRS